MMEATKTREEYWRDMYMSAQEDVNLLKARLAAIDNPETVWVIGQRLQMKTDRQRKALARLGHRVRAQRLQLRRLNELGRGLSADEWKEAKELYPNELVDPDQIKD
jgi:hypothetical protein